MSNEIHWAVDSLNKHLNGCDAQADEVDMWRNWYVKEFMKDKTEYQKYVFRSLPSQSFKDKTPEQVLKEQCEFSNEQ